MDVGTKNTLYLGWSKVGTAPYQSLWKIKKVFIIDGNIEETYANGDSGYCFVWNNRTTYDYI